MGLTERDTAPERLMAEAERVRRWCLSCAEQSRALAVDREPGIIIERFPGEILSALENMEQLCAAAVVIDSLKAALESLRAAEEQLRQEAVLAKAALHDICCEWSEANGAICNETCSTFGHDADCKAINIAAYLAALRAELEAAKALGEQLQQRAETAEADWQAVERVLSRTEKIVDGVRDHIALLMGDAETDARPTLEESVRRLEAAWVKASTEIARLTASNEADARRLGEAEADRERYYELIFAVAKKYPGETRHETALRYIVEAERGSPDDAMTGVKSDGGGR